MTNRLQLKKRIIKTSILATVMFTHTGCFFGYFGGPKIIVEEEKEVIVTPAPVTSAPVSANFIDYKPVAECTDNDTSSCSKPPIEIYEVKEKVEISSGNEVHKLQSIQGKNITVEERSNGFLFPEYENKIVILEMFGKNCPYCIKEMPTLNKLRRKYKGKLEIIAVQVEDKMSSSEAKRLIRRHKIHYPIIAGDTATNLQYNIQNTYGWTGILPFTMVVKDGVTEFTYPGAVSYKEMNKNIRSIIR